MVAASRHAEELRQLCQGDGERCPGLETDQDCFANEANEPAQAQQPRQHTQTGNHQRCKSGNIHPARRIALRHARDSNADEHCNRRGRSDGELS